MEEEEEEDVPECCRNKHGRRSAPTPPLTRAGPRASPARPFSPAYGQRCSTGGPAVPAPCAQPSRSQAYAPSVRPTFPPAAQPAYGNYSSPDPSFPVGSPDGSPHMQVAPMQFSNMLEEPTESCIIIEEEIERVEPIDFPDNMQNFKKEVKLVRPYGVVIQTIEEVIEELPRGAARPSVLQRTRRKVTRKGSGGAGGRSPPSAPPWDCQTALPWESCDRQAAAAAAASAVDHNAAWAGNRY